MSDKWSEWLKKKRFGDSIFAESSLKWLFEQRATILGAAAINKGETVLDAGAGDGVLGIGAMDLIGETGKIIFCDISSDALALCKEAYDVTSFRSHAEFIVAGVEDLSVIPDCTVDVIIERAVLLYTQLKQSALREYRRILRPGGRLSMQEPVNRFVAERLAERKIFFGYDFTPLGVIGEKILSAFEFPPDYRYNTMLNYDERDLMNWLLEAGFREIRMLYDAQLHSSGTWPSFEAFLHSSPNPNAPTLYEAMERELTPTEQKQSLEYFRPLVKNQPALRANAIVNFLALK